MNDRTTARRRGIRMAMQVATLTIGAGAIGAAAAEEARADTTSMASGGPDVASVEKVTTQGWSCWGAPVSRGPLAPPLETSDFARLLDEVPA